ncbi:MAG: hypothetical protein AABY62_05675 [Pseudomonadota bacterium]
MSDPARDARALPDDVMAALRRGNKIEAATGPSLVRGPRLDPIAEAIKRLREAWAIGLKEAKDHVDGHIAADPLLRQKLSAASVSGARGCLFWLILLLFIGFGVYQLLTGR